MGKFYVRVEELTVLIISCAYENTLSTPFNSHYIYALQAPIRYIFGCVGQSELAAYYRDAAVALVTPLRDGMNLVAKEFVACQINEPPGKL